MTRAAELAERLARIAEESTLRAELDRAAASHVAVLADAARTATERMVESLARAATPADPFLAADGEVSAPLDQDGHVAAAVPTPSA